MKGSNLYVLPERLNVDVTNCAKSDSSIRFESLYQAFALDSLIELLLDRDEHFCGHALELNLRRETNLFVVNGLIDRGTFNGVGDKDVTAG